MMATSDHKVAHGWDESEHRSQTLIVCEETIDTEIMIYTRLPSPLLVFLFANSLQMAQVVAAASTICSRSTVL